MASLKEVKVRINSVTSTRKITSAMKMIASAKLHKAQMTIGNFIPYQEKLNTTLTNLLAADAGYSSPYAHEREVKRVAIVAFASNSTLCGGYNANSVKGMTAAFNEYKGKIGKDNVLIYPIGKNMTKAAKKLNVEPQGDYQEMADKPSYEAALQLSQELVEKFLNKELDEIILIYHHFKSTASQILTHKKFLPFDLSTNKDDESNFGTDYILEPSREEILSVLIPQVLNATVYAALLDSNTSEHAARTVAMQVATDNADDLIQDLTIQYNKSRQQAITNELLDIIGGAAALE